MGQLAHGRMAFKMNNVPDIRCLTTVFQFDHSAPRPALDPPTRRWHTPPPVTAERSLTD
jgi:hypothetical protein